MKLGSYQLCMYMSHALADSLSFKLLTELDCLAFIWLMGNGLHDFEILLCCFFVTD